MTLSVWTTQQIIDQLDSGSYWSGQSIITYDFPTVTTWLTGSTELSQFVALNTTQQNMATLAITLWGDLIPQTLQKITPTSSNTGNIDLAAFNGPSSDYAHTYFPTSGTVWFNDYYNGTTGGITNNLVAPAIGQHGFATYIHELGHAFGLNHSGNYNVGSGTPEPTHYEDSTVYSIMSYFGPSFGDGTDSNTGQLYSTEIAWGNWLGYDAQTPMLDDILAIQTAYGVSTTTRTGNTVYGFHSNVTGPEASIYDFTQNAHPIMCIFDSSGNDTLDLSGDTHNDVINLHSGAFSSVMGMTNNLSIAYSCTIENAVGGSGADTIYGNDAGDMLKGGAGNDHLIGGAGSDQLYGGAGADVLDGGGGLNAAAYWDSPIGLTINLSNPAQNTGDAAGDSYINVQCVGGTAYNDIITGDSGTNYIWGGGGNDFIYGGAGNDYLYGGAGSDQLYGGPGADVLDGGAGLNAAAYWNSPIGLTINLANPAQNTGDAAGDSYVNIQCVGGTAYNDIITGDSGNNSIWAGGGNDVLNGGGGNDYLSGGAGKDTFVYLAANFGNDEIADFSIGQDQIEISKTLVASFSALSISQSSANAIIHIGNDSIQLDNIISSNLTANDFIFV